MYERTNDALAPNRVHVALVLGALCLGSLTLTGCSKTETAADNSGASSDSEQTLQATGDREDAIQSAADMLAAGGEPDVGKETFSPQSTPMAGELERELPDSGERSDSQSISSVPAPPPASPAADGDDSTDAKEIVGVPLRMSAEPTDPSASVVADSEKKLRENLTADQLAEVLESSDLDMETIAGGRGQINDPEKASRLLESIARIKLEASLKLQSADGATDQQKSDGLRGQLQALSHLAAMGDAAAAQALESVAKDHLDSSDASVAGDSRIVLIGFAIDALQAGQASAPKQIVQLVEEMKSNPRSDVPNVLIMAQARQMLANYGMVEQAIKVRDKILELYGDSSDAMIAQVAADAAGTAKFDRVNRLLRSILQDETIVVAHWTDAVSDLVTDSPEMNTVRFLAKSALELEAAGRDAFVDETFSILADQFTDPESATRREIELAKLAMDARRKVIGTKFDFSPLPSVDGKGVPLSETKDKVILMPFWAMTVPESLQIVPLLKEIRQEHAESVAIVGMNIDSEQAPLTEFLADFELGFPSFQSVSSADQEVPNPIAARFGLMSMPFVAVIDQQGYVAALSFTGRELPGLVKQLTSNQE